MVSGINQQANYSKRFQKLRRDFKNGGAPHKPILLLAVIELIEEGNISSNRIYITPELVSKFKDLWKMLVITNHHPTFALPFFHMRSEGFWHLVSKPGIIIPLTSSGSIKSFKGLFQAIDYAEIDLNLFMLLCNVSTREVLKDILFRKYFPETMERQTQKTFNPYLFEIKKEVVENGPDEYRAKMTDLFNTLTIEEFEEERFLRSSVFRKEILKHYNYACCISGFRIDATENVSLIDACHIVPFSKSHDDTIPNGIPLCPNLHRAFDGKLISISENYEVIVSSRFIEYKETPYSIRQFAGVKIALPDDHKHYPSQINFSIHRKECYMA